MAEIKGTIFNIKRFSVHDGPGIRTSVFLKGCPLSCIWCHNPEGISPQISIWYNKNTCIACGECVEACPNKALFLYIIEDKLIEINHNLCTLNGECVKICPTGAIQFTGTVSTVSEIMTEIMKDQLYFQTSGGGVTITGGEPALQPDFCIGILRACKASGIHTATETCLFCEQDVLEKMLDYTDLFIVDLKIFDQVKHEQYTGRGNEKIKDNLRYLVAAEKEILVRVPLIINITDNIENKTGIEKFVNDLDPGITVEYLNYNPLARNKYQRLCIPFPMDYSNEITQ